MYMPRQIEVKPMSLDSELPASKPNSRFPMSLDDDDLVETKPMFGTKVKNNENRAPNVFQKPDKFQE